MKQKIKQKYDQVDRIYVRGLLLNLSTKWGVSVRYIREGLIGKDLLSDKQEKELLHIIDVQIKFQDKIKEIEKKHFKNL